MSRAEIDVGHLRDYDPELGKITEQDRELACDLMMDVRIAETEERKDIIAQYFRKARYEAVMADRKGHSR